MSTSRLSRAAAAVLATLFLGGVGGVSALDAILFHRTGTAVSTGVAHVESAATATCHAERCALALRLASGRVAPRLDLQIRFEGIPQHAAAHPPASAPRRAPAGSQQQPRAPPTSIA